MTDDNIRNPQSSKGLLGRLLGLGKEPRPSEPLIVPRAEHNISRKNMEEEVLKVLYRLHNSGQMAYLVGGAVRDLLLERKPKDYDVATDARPDQIKKLFVNSRLIGRRFRLAHIVFRGGKVIEVSTFRRSPVSHENGEEEPEGEEKDLLIREDNTWGNPQQDAYRRDFTINALFYNIADFSVIDYVGGLADLNAGIIRTIGDPNIRLREDPVRMIRAVEYSTRLDFEMTPELLRGIRKHRKDLRRASDARIADELLHLLRSGASEKAFRQLWSTGLLEILYSDLHLSLTSGGDEQFFSELAMVDRWTNEGRTVRDTLLFGVLFRAPLRDMIARAEEKKGGRLSKGEYLNLVDRVLEGDVTLYRVPTRRLHQLKQAMLGAYKMRRRPMKQRGLKSMIERSYFPDALDLFNLEVEVTGKYGNVLKEWQELKSQAPRRDRRPDSDRGRDARDRGRGRGRGERERRAGRGDSRKGKRERPDERSKPDHAKSERRAPARREEKPRRDKRSHTPEVEAKPPVAEAGPPEVVEKAAPAIDITPPEEMEHGRGKRETRSWNGVAGQQSAVIRDMKKMMEEGEMTGPGEEEIPYVVPGQSLKDTTRDWEENVGRADEMAADESKPESEKWGRKKRPSPPKL